MRSSNDATPSGFEQRAPAPSQPRTEQVDSDVVRPWKGRVVYSNDRGWRRLREDVVYDSEWVRVLVAEVETQDGSHLQHHVIEIPLPAAGAVIVDPSGRTLLIWRYRFIQNQWGWEVPAGRVEMGESPSQAAARETWEETGWRVDALQPLVAYEPMVGISNQRHYVFSGRPIVRSGGATDTSETTTWRWFDRQEVRNLVRTGKVLGGLSITALLAALDYGPLQPGGQSDELTGL